MTLIVCFCFLIPDTSDVAFIVAFIHYLGLFLYYPVVYLLDQDLPVVSSMIILMEQVR
jgi:hypothetical protein